MTAFNLYRPARRATALLVLALLTGAAAGAERWRMQYLYDEAKSSFAINDLKFASPRRGVAVGFVGEGKKVRPMSLVTADGGEHWNLLPIREVGVSLFFLNEELGWMVTHPRGLWVTTEAGRSWRRVPDSPKGLFRVWFLDEKHGFGVGARKLVVETRDGGAHWTPVPAANDPKTTADYTTYNWIDFTGRHGVITGFSQVPRRGDQRLPDWLEPDEALSRTERPHLTITLKTDDSGQNWRADTASMFGRMTRFRVGAGGFALALLEFAASFAFPSEVYQINGRTGATVRTFREKDRAITDAWVTPSGAGYLAGIEVVGKLRTSAIPGKLKMLHSADLAKWTEMDVDYRAVATRATLSVVDDRNLWVATDTGMILKLEP